MAEIITLAQAKMGAKLDASLTLDDADLQLRLDAAHALVLTFVDNNGPEAWHETVVGWDETSAPNEVKAAILAMFTYIVRRRGDDAEKDDLPQADLPAAVRMYIQRLREPTVA